MSDRRLSDRRFSGRHLSVWRIVVLLAAAGVFVCLVLLGNWQMRRLDWKEGLLAAVETRQGEAPVSLGDIERLRDNGADIEYQPVTVEGRFQHDRERHFFATHDGQSGYYIYTPLLLDDGRFVFINRGFVPFDLKEAATRPAGQVGGAVTVTGLARAGLSEKPSFVVPDNDVSGNIFYWKDLATMAGSVGLSADTLLPFFIDADATPNPGGLPVGGVTRISFPNDHLQYALTWYGLAAVLAVGVIILFVRRKARQKDGSAS